jgi:cell division protein FtsB
VRKIAFVLFCIFCLIIIQGLLSSIIELWQRQDIIKQARLQLEAAKKEHQELREKMRRAEDASYIETEARNKLFMIKPGEHIVILPPQKAEKPLVKTPREKRISVYQQWINLFFRRIE